MFRIFGFREIRPPLMERTELFSRSIGQDTDIVAKEMYTFTDSKGRGMTLRPEATASVVRAYVQHRLYQQYPVQKLFTVGAMFRHERPQKGRFRQFHQVNAEILGDPGPRSDTDLIIMAMLLLQNLGLSGLALHLNSLGCRQCRAVFKQELKNYLTKNMTQLCSDCQRRARSNPLRVFDCKVPTCGDVVAEAPSIPGFICPACESHFSTLQGELRRAGYQFVLDPNLVRGLDYYNRTTFEIQTAELGAQNAVLGGGRYDGLARLLGGPDHPAIGFALGMERVVALLDEKGALESKKAELFVATLGRDAHEKAFDWILELRKEGFWVETEYGRKGLKAQMKRADRLGARKVLIVGENELNSGKGILRDMQTREQQEIDLDDLANALREEF